VSGTNKMKEVKGSQPVCPESLRRVYPTMSAIAAIPSVPKPQRQDGRSFVVCVNWLTDPNFVLHIAGPQVC